MARQTFRIAFLHLAPVPGDLIQNRREIETVTTRAAQTGATRIIIPELAICGYTFAETLGTDWIEPQPDQWGSSLCRLTARLRVTLFLSHPERDRKTDTLYNSLFVITSDRCIVGSHRKVNTLRVGSEAWSSPGDRAEPIAISDGWRVGLLICADTYTPCNRQEPQSPRGSNPCFLSSLGSRAAWPKRRMGMVHKGHGISAAHL